MDDYSILQDDIVQLARLSILGNSQDIRLYIARLVRKYRQTNSELSNTLNQYLSERPGGRSGILRQGKNPNNPQTSQVPELPAYLTHFTNEDAPIDKPIFSHKLENEIDTLIKERSDANKLYKAGLAPSSSAFFIGKPGVGKTLTAKWIAQAIGLPLYVLDLASIMSSFLGQTGTNLKNALSYAKTNPCVLLLDEVDAIAKKRADDFDIGEMKRIVTVILQEVDNWPSQSFLIAATNHSELVDPALWRRFDHVLQFELPDDVLVSDAIKRFLKSDYVKFENYINLLTLLFSGSSFSDIEKKLQGFRRSMVIDNYSATDVIQRAIDNSNVDMNRKLDLAKALQKTGDFSQRAINRFTGVSRDTLRKYQQTSNLDSNRKESNYGN